MNKIDRNISKIVSSNLEQLMAHYDLTTYALESGAELEIHTINKILSQKTNISTYSAKKIAAFFDISIDALFSVKPLKLRKIESTPSIKKFYADNKLNDKYFKTRQEENTVAKFIRKIALTDSTFQTNRRAGKIAEYIEEKYKNGYLAETIRKELDRMYQEGTLEREDKTGAGAVFYYKLKNKTCN